jgi:hypothetical protein
MTREEAKNIANNYTNYDNACDDLIDSIYDDFEIKLKDAESYFDDINTVNCKSCKHHLSDNGNFPLEPCCECGLFYGNKWESK